jgi:hypothetical protein
LGIVVKQEALQTFILLPAHDVGEYPASNQRPGATYPQLSTRPSSPGSLHLAGWTMPASSLNVKMCPMDRNLVNQHRGKKKAAKSREADLLTAHW